MNTEENNIFDNLDSLSMGQNYDDISVDVLTTHIPLRKPNNSEFIRVNPDPESRKVFMFLKYTPPAQMTEDLYLVTPDIAKRIGDLPNLKLHLVVTAVSRPDDTPFLWPIRLPNADMASDIWALTDQAILQQAEKDWIRRSSQKGGQGYIGAIPKAKFPEPNFPEMSFVEMLKKAIPEEKFISEESHTVVRRLRGEI